MDKGITKQEVESMIQFALKQNQFNLSPVSYHEHTGIDSPKVSYQDLETAPQTFIVATDTTGTTTVPIFGAGGMPYNFTITGVFLISKDTTAGNVFVNNKGALVATIAKGATAGALVGASSIANTSYSMGSALTIVSSSAGNATVFVTYILS